MDAVPECDVPVGRAGDVEAVGVGECFLVAIGGTVGYPHELARGYNDAADLDLGFWHSPSDLIGAVVAQHFLHRRSGEAGIALEGRELVRKFEQRVDAAAALASIVKCENLQVFAFDDNVREVPPRRGMAGVDAITRMVRGGTNLGYAVGFANNIPHDRLIVITDEQSHDRVPAPRAKHAYLINVASYQNGVGYRNGWTHIDGFSESILRYVHAHESGTLFGGDDTQSTSED